MAKEVFLMADVADLGAEGDVVTVADGYARNYLLPKGLAAPVTEATRRQLAKIQRDRNAQEKAELEAAQQMVAKLNDVSCTITVKTADDEKLYGSVTAGDIADALKEQGLDIDRHSLILEAPIKELGVFDVGVKLHRDAEATIKIWVVEE